MNAAPETCVNCGQPLPAGMAFCQACGTARAGAAPSTDSPRPPAGPAASPSPTLPPSAVTAPSGSGVGLKLLAALHLVGALVLGAPQLGEEAQELSSNAEHESFGGDAYTGIQNAAADTENAVVEAANSQAADLQDVKRLMGGLLIGSGLLHVGIAFRPRQR